MNYCKLFLLSVLVVPVTIASAVAQVSDNPESTYRDFKADLDTKFLNQFKSLQDAYVRRISEAKATLITSLELKRDEYAKNVDLDNANKIQARIDDLRSASIEPPLPTLAEFQRMQRVLGNTAKATDDVVENTPACSAKGSDWKLLFRGLTGESWGRDRALTPDGMYATAFDKSIPISHLRLTNAVTGESVILRWKTTTDKLLEEVELADGWIWNGTAQFYAREGDNSKGVWRLGLANKRWNHTRYKDKATIAGPKFGYGGFGFARFNHNHNPDGTTYMWADELVPTPFVLEVSITNKDRVGSAEGLLLN